MTLIVGIEHEGVVYMGADSGFWSNSAVDSTPRSKLVWNGPVTMGLAGTNRAGNLIRHALDELPNLDAGEDPESYMVRHFVTRLRAMLSEHGAMEKDGDGSEKWDGNMLAACGGQLFQVSNYFCVFRNARGYACGGHDLAMAVAAGVLAVTHHMEPRERLAIALATAADHTDVVRAPFSYDPPLSPAISVAA